MNRHVKMNYEEKTIILARSFAKKAQIMGSGEYNELLEVKANFPDYKIKIREIAKNANKETYRGLTYSYMEDYIMQYDRNGRIMDEYRVLRLRAECHTIRYPAIKKWFLTKFPEVKDLKMTNYNLDHLTANEKVA